jgi:hypothetical protein
MVVDNPIFPGISEPGTTGDGVSVENRYLEDRTLVYVDRDPTNDPTQVTGARVVPSDLNFGADVVVNVAGKAGRVITSLSDIHQWTVTGWTKVQGQVPSAASDYHNLEISVPLGTIGMNPTITPETYVVTTDWRKNYDDTQPYSNRGPTASTVYAEERSVAPDTVMLGDTNVPIIRIDLENREETPAEITDVRALLIGSATEADIDSIRLWTGDRVFNTFDPERFTEVSEGNTWTGRDVIVDLATPVVVRPLDTLSLILTVDISPTATTLLWFDLHVLAERGLMASGDVIATGIHDDYRLVRIWNTTGGRFTSTIGINEVYWKVDRQGSTQYETDKWIELVNPTGSNVDLDGWTLEIDVSQQSYVIKYFGSSDSISGSSSSVGTKVWFPDETLNTTLYLKKDAALYLRDDTGTTISYVLVGNTQKGYSWSRYRVQGSDEPHGSATANGASWYTEDTPTPNARNDEIPEFSDIVYPLMGTLVVYAVVRRRSTGRSRSEQSVPAPA